MSVARHPRPKELEGVSIDEIMKKFVGRYSEKRADWAAFEDAKIEGFKRAQHRFIGAGGSGKHDDPTVIPAKNFTLSIMFVPPAPMKRCCARLKPSILASSNAAQSPRFSLKRPTYFFMISSTGTPSNSFGRG